MSTTTTNWKALCAEQLPELRGMFERILCVARSSRGPTVGNIQLADRLIDAVVSWSATTLAQPEPEEATDEELCQILHQAICDFPPTHPDALNLDARQYEIALELHKARAVLARWGRPAIKPVRGRFR